jgi:hypothetical protein
VRRPVGVPWSGPGYSAGSRDVTSAARLGLDDLTWSEVADAVWLTSVTQDAWRRHTAPERTPQDSDRAHLSARTQAPGSGILPERGFADRVEPSDRPIDHPAARLLADLGGVTQLAAPNLPGAADIVRALRPLKRKVPCWYEDEVVLDEDATAEQAVQDWLWLPVTTPDTERWLDLTLVVDTNPSMALWRSTVTAFISLSERLGTFRTIQLRLLDTHGPAEGSPATPVLRGGTPVTPIRGPAELLDLSGRRMLLVLTDGVGQCWRQDLVSPLLAQWGASMPVAVVHLLPQPAVGWPCIVPG